MNLRQILAVLVFLLLVSFPFLVAIAIRALVN